MSKLDDQLAALETLSPAQLRDEWARVHQRSAPKLTPALLMLGIAYALQAHASGKRGRATKLPTMVGSRAAKRAPVIPPGTQLVRSWNGRTVSVVADERGFLFDGKSYPSLSAIARAVTGAHWSGPRFFGLTGTGTGRG